MLIVLSLTILIVLTLFSIILGSSGNIAFYNELIDSNLYDSFVDETIELSSIPFSLDSVLGAIAILLTIITLASIVGFAIFGSGLNSQSVRTIIIIVAFSGIWGILSVLAYPLIIDIEIFGNLIYITLTIMYALGCIINLASG